MNSAKPTFTSREYLGLLSASVLLSAHADDDAETYGTDADYADRALSKVWEHMAPAEQRKVRQKLNMPEED